MALLVALLIAGCGGGGGGSSTTDDTATPGVIVEAVLAAPTDLSAKAGDSSAIISFSVADPAAVSAFLTECAVGQTAPVRLTTPSHGTDTEQASLSLTNDQTYTCTVTALSATTASQPSTPVKVTPSGSTPASVPEAPRDVSATAGDRSATISFTAPLSDNGSAIENYTATCSGGDVNRYSTATASPITVPLGNDPSYDCSVVATNGIGDGPPSSSVKVTPVAATPASPNAPSAVSGVSARGGNQSISVSFTAPADAGAGATYQATCTAKGVAVSNESSASPVTVGVLENGTAHSCTVTTIIAGLRSSESASATATPFTTPNAPTTVSAVAGDTSATVSFGAPDKDGGSPISRYLIDCSPGSSSAQSVAPGSAIVGGLVNDTLYTCTVKAHNDAGDGPAAATTVTPSRSQAAAPVAGETAPLAPTATEIVAGNGSATINFVPSASGSVAAYYIATCSADQQADAHASGTTLSLTVTKLTNNVNYGCTVVAHNTVDSSPSNKLYATPAAGVPDRPTSVSGEPRDQSARISFTPGNDNGSPVRSYAAYCGDTLPAYGSSSPIDVTGLVNGTLYSCYVTATSDAGTSPDSDTVPVKPRTVPGQVTSVQAAVGDGKLTLGFTKTSDTGGADIDHYDGKCSLGTSNPSTVQIGAAGTSIVIPNLTNGSTYTCWVVAHNTAGDSGYSTITQIPNGSAPTAPAPDSIATTIDNGTLTFTLPSSSGNSADTTTSVSCKNDDTAAVSPGTSAGNGTYVVSDLTNSSSYTCTITVTNSAGSTSTVVKKVPNASKPTAPTGVGATTGNAQLTLRFTPPTANLGDVLYTATCLINNKAAGNGSTGSTSPQTVTALTNGQAYSCYVTATNSKGSSDSMLTIGIPNAGTPNSPTLTSIGVADRQLALYFTSNNNLSDVAYQGFCSTAGSATVFTTVLQTSTDALIVPGLTNGTTYGCYVTATNNVGSSKTGTSYKEPNASLPQPPDVAVSTTPADGQLTFVFSKPTNTSDVTYGAVCQRDAGPPVSNVVVTKGATTITVVAKQLTNDAEYTCYGTATNSVGTAMGGANKGTPYTTSAPGTPSTPAASVGDYQITLTYTAGSEGHLATTYAATCTPVGSSTGVTKAGSTTTATVTGLTSAISYTCTVSATNAKGTTTSLASSVVQPTGVPASPAGAAALSGNASATVSFTAGATGGYAITQYTASCTPAAGGTPVPVNGTSSPITVTGLTNGTLYTCSVKATNSKGTGPASTSAPVIPATKPGTVQNLGVTALDGQAMFTFDAPASNGGAAISSYAATCTSTTDASDSKTINQLSTPIYVTGLTNGKSYSCSAKASNAAGTGPSAIYGSNVTPSIVPLPPLTATALAQKSQITLTYSAPANNATIASYTATCTAAGSSSPVVRTGVSPGSLVFTGLSNETTYDCTVYATNSSGIAGPEYSPHLSVAMPTAPGVPTVTSATPGNTYADIEFTAPSSNGGDAISSYTVNCQGVEKSTAASPFRFTGLTNNQTASCSVKATNGIGSSPSSAAMQVTPGRPATPEAPTYSPTSGKIVADVRIESVASSAVNGGGTLQTAWLTCGNGNTTAPFATSGTAMTAHLSLTVSSGSYLCSLKVTNSLGVSSLSSALTSVPSL
ncbi:fibronectin type III domain-containing protein [Rhizobacter sp. OV335]|uniref:beta strand repeat-containing protein n=1 Tax=Rhizobacter sp. OV335 TaxID=1500264 RepID=UPI000916C4F7|nr:fibronectin type III domain-containing protein [Rhizobacter sp. OV335]SHM39701.1 Fibronectin type III domain-containing protein [Rhizobacter sp. OV335]